MERSLREKNKNQKTTVVRILWFDLIHRVSKLAFKAYGFFPLLGCFFFFVFVFWRGEEGK